MVDMGPSPDELKLKTLESKSLAGKIIMELERDDLDINDFIRLLWVCPPSDLIEQEYATLLQYKAKGKDITQDQAEQIRLKKVIYMGFKEALFNMDALSLLGGLNFDNDSRYIPWKVFNTATLTLNVEKGGKFILISGNMGTGKTHLASILANDIMVTKGLHILSNINFLEKHDKLKRIYSTSELLIEGIKISLKGEKWVAILDESGVWQHTQDHATKKNISWDKIYRLIRKFQGSMIFIDQRVFGFTRTLKEFSTVQLHNHSKSTLKAHIFDTELKGVYYLKSIPQTPMAFDTNDIAYFRHDIDVDNVLAKATNITGSEKQKMAIIKFLEDEKEKNKTNDLTIGDKEVAIYIRLKSIEMGRKLSYQDIGDLLGRSATAINMWYRQYELDNESSRD